MAGEAVRDAEVHTTSFFGPMQGAEDSHVFQDRTSQVPVWSRVTAYFYLMASRRKLTPQRQTTYSL